MTWLPGMERFVYKEVGPRPTALITVVNKLLPRLPIHGDAAELDELLVHDPLEEPVEGRSATNRRRVFQATAGRSPAHVVTEPGKKTCDIY